MCNNTGSVLQLQLIVGELENLNWDFIFSTNDLHTSVHVFVLLETPETYQGFLNSVKG